MRSHRFRRAAFGGFCFALILSLPLPVFAAPGFKHLPIKSCGALLFCGEGSQMRVEFNADATSPNPDAFAEPPLTIRYRDGRSSCSVVEGGIWPRARVYLREDEQVVLVEEYSGSHADVVQYATDDCRELRRIDVSQHVWAIKDGMLLIGEQCGGRDVTTCKIKRKRVLTSRRQ